MRRSLTIKNKWLKGVNNNALTTLQFKFYDKNMSVKCQEINL
jgi:hypothetical protein